MKVQALEIDDAFPLCVLDIGILDVPLLGHSPIEDLRPRWNFSNLQGNETGQNMERLPDAITRDAVANGI